MSELVNRAIRFATEAHERIDHRRKYNNLSYTVHLGQVAEITASITDDQEMISAAWLHDVVEDTPATLEDIEREFGSSVAILVRELTDISKPSDGNRTERKSLDKRHLAEASGRAQTIKLADLIDNCKDITKHDPRFARVYVNEMNALLNVLVNADEGLMSRARRTMEKSISKLGKSQLETEESDTNLVEDVVFETHFKRH